MELREKKKICYAAASLSLQMQQISLSLSNPNNLSIKFHISLLDWYLNQRIKTESKMYMAYGWPQVIPLEQGLCPSSQKHIIYFKVINRLFLVVSPSHLELWSSSQVFSHLHGVYDHIHVLVFLWLWKTRVLDLWIFVRFCDYLQHKVRLGKYKRNAESLEREGENLLAVWRPDTKLIAILVSIFFFYILISFMYTIALFMANFDYSRVIYSHTFTPITRFANACTWFWSNHILEITWFTYPHLLRFYWNWKIGRCQGWV